MPRPTPLHFVFECSLGPFAHAAVTLSGEPVPWEARRAKAVAAAIGHDLGSAIGGSREASEAIATVAR